MNRKMADRTIVEQIDRTVLQLPIEKQVEVLDFIVFLQKRQNIAQPTESVCRSLKAHPAFGSWKNRAIDALEFEQAVRAEWDNLS